MVNTGIKPIIIKKDARIAQFTFKRVYHPTMIAVEMFPDTNRGTTGFGNSGI